jgi:hypothetical protein
MGINRFKTVLKYKASRDGWTVKDFHRLSDGIGPSITLYKIKNGSCIGGFTSAKWSSTPSHTFANDPSALLFNLALKTFFPCKKQTHALKNSVSFGPSFGDNELSVRAPFNGENNCWSNTNKIGYKLEKDSEEKNTLTNEKC